MPSTGPALERELRSILIRHLPIGLEGIGLAQTTAVITLLDRRNSPRARPAVDAAQRRGMRILQSTAEEHAASATLSPLGTGSCGMCLDAAGLPSEWPCPAWTSAELLRLVGGAPVEVG